MKNINSHLLRRLQKITPRTITVHGVRTKFLKRRRFRVYLDNKVIAEAKTPEAALIYAIRTEKHKQIMSCP